MNEKLNDDVNENPDTGPEYESSSPGDPEELDLDKEHFDEVLREKAVSYTHLRAHET